MNSPERRQNYRLQRTILPLLEPIRDRFRLRILFESEQDLETFVLPALNNQYLTCVPKYCLHCRCDNHSAWVKLWCGGCEKIFWLSQDNLHRGRWCLSCSFAWQRASPQRALAELVGEPFHLAVLKIENREDLHLRWLAWRVRQAVKRAVATSNSAIIATICDTHVRVPKMWQVPPHKWDHVCRRFACFKRNHKK